MNYTLLNAYENEDYYTRYPKSVISSLGYNGHIGGQEKAYDMAGVEIRYLSEAKSFNLMLNISGTGFCSLYIGDFSIARIPLVDGFNYITNSLHERYLNLLPMPKLTYPDNLFRVILEPGYKLKSIDLLDDLACPYDEILPTALLYGSSFTEGAGSLANPYSYASILGKLLNIDILNKGLSGNCLCEKELANYLASLNPNIYILELGCNMRGYMDKYEFEKRVNYLLQTLTSAGKKVYVISSLTFFVKEFICFKNPPYHDKNKDFAKILAKLAKKYNVNLISMTKLMKSFKDVSYDMLHPSQIGHLNIAYNLMRYIKQPL